MKIEYSIISRGSEKYINHGYMGITEIENNKRYLLDIDHGITEINDINNYLHFKSDYSIQNISFSRFELISALLFKRIHIKDNILICGIGNVGFGCLINLLKKGYKNISIFSRSCSNDLGTIEKYFGVKIRFVDKINDDYNTYIETTGNIEVLKNIFDSISYLKAIIILGTYHEGIGLIDPTLINRKNISIYGGHEFNGISREYRNEIFDKLLKDNKKIENLLYKYVSINKYTKENLKNCLIKKGNIIEIFKY